MTTDIIKVVATLAISIVFDSCHNVRETVEEAAEIDMTCIITGFILANQKYYSPETDKSCLVMKIPGRII